MHLTNLIKQESRQLMERLSLNSAIKVTVYSTVKPVEQDKAA